MAPHKRQRNDYTTNPFFNFLKDFRKQMEGSANAALISKEGGKAWAQLTDADKQPYYDQAAEVRKKTKTWRRLITVPLLQKKRIDSKKKRSRSQSSLKRHRSSTKPVERPSPEGNDKLSSSCDSIELRESDREYEE